MINFSEEIKKLLIDNDFLILPKIGAFVANYTQPSIDPTSNQIIEPSKYFSFNPFFVEDDNNKFFNKISSTHMFTSKEVEDQYSIFQKEIKLQLKNINEYKVEDLGFFYTNSNGLLDFNFSKIESLPEPEIKIVTPEAVEVIEPFEDNLDNNGINYSQSIIKLKEDTNPYGKLVKVLLYAAPLVLLFWGLYNLLFKNDISNKEEISVNESQNIEYKSDLDSNSINDESNINSETEKTLPKNSISKSINSKPTETINKDKKIVSSDQNSNKNEEYRVIVGLYRNYENAEALKENLISKGINANADYKGELKRIFVKAPNEKEAKKLKIEIENITGEKAVYNKIN